MNLGFGRKREAKNPFASCLRIFLSLMKQLRN